MLVTVPITIDSEDAEHEFGVRVDVGKWYHMYSDDCSSFGPMCRSIEIVSARREDGSDATTYVRDYLDANSSARSAFEDAACQEADQEDQCLREEAAERRAESMRDR